MRSVPLLLCVLLFVQLSGAQTSAPKRSTDVELARRFVQSFYDWYVPQALKDGDGPAFGTALRMRSAVFEPVLFRALREDLRAQAKAHGEIVGLDFDPFLNSQDPERRYKAFKTVLKNGSYFVYVKSAAPTKTEVVAKVDFHSGRWRFANFLYPEGADLLNVLRALRRSASHHR